ncbi:MAG TPA: hypothetical protein VKE96_22735 [Vicinamibacterales bacterium]|nr:hypothetical protein [Vicinamibacterales bacterium]
MIAIEPRRRFQPAASLCLLALVASARPGLASTLTFTAVHANYQPGAAASATITDTVTDTVRWDLTKVLQRTVLAGGEDVGRDAASRATITMSGSGSAQVGKKDATGGGTFVLTQRDRRDRDDGRDDDGHEREHGRPNQPHEIRGIYVVTGFEKWQPADGSLKIADGIGHPSEATSGILTLKVRLFPAAGGHMDGVLTVNSRLPDRTFDIDEGITLAVEGFHFVQDEGQALFHVPK